MISCSSSHVYTMQQVPIATTFVTSSMSPVALSQGPERAQYKSYGGNLHSILSSMDGGICKLFEKKSPNTAI